MVTAATKISIEMAKRTIPAQMVRSAYSALPANEEGLEGSYDSQMDAYQKKRFVDAKLNEWNMLLEKGAIEVLNPHEAGEVRKSLAHRS